MGTRCMSSVLRTRKTIFRLPYDQKFAQWFGITIKVGIPSAFCERFPPLLGMIIVCNKLRLFCIPECRQLRWRSGTSGSSACAAPSATTPSTTCWRSARRRRSTTCTPRTSAARPPRGWLRLSIGIVMCGPRVSILRECYVKQFTIKQITQVTTISAIQRQTTSLKRALILVRGLQSSPRSKRRCFMGLAY